MAVGLIGGARVEDCENNHQHHEYETTFHSLIPPEEAVPTLSSSLPAISSRLAAFLVENPQDAGKTIEASSCHKYVSPPPSGYSVIDQVNLGQFTA